MEAIYSPRAQSLSLIPRTSPPLCGIPSIRLQFLGRAHRLANSKLRSRKRNSRKQNSSSGRRNPAPSLRIVASLSSGQFLVVVVAAVSAFSFVYLNYFSRRKKPLQKVSPSPASEQSEKPKDTALTDLSTQDLTVHAFHVESVKEIEESVEDTREKVVEKDANEYQYAFHSLETASINGDIQTVNSLELADSLNNEQHVSTSWIFEGNEDVFLPLQIKVPESDTVPSFDSVTEVSEWESDTLPSFASSSGSVSDTEEEDTLETSNGHIEHVSTEFDASPKESAKGELHLFFDDEDQSVTTASNFLHGIPELYSQVSHRDGDDISASTSVDTVELLHEGNGFLPSGYSERNGSLLSNKSSNSHRRKELGKGRETETCENIGLLSHDNQHLSLSRRTNVVEKESPVDKLNSYHKLLRYGRLQECITLLEEMDKEGELDMNKVYHSRFLSLCRSQKAVNEAFRFVKLIPNPTLSTFNMLMSVCSSAQDSDGAAKVWQLVQESGFKADCKLYTTMISTYGKCGKVDAMFKAFHEMGNSGVEPNLHTYGALIDGCARSGQIAKAFGAYGILRSKKVKPDRVIFNALITACGHSGAIGRAFDVLQEMRAEPHPIDPDHITIGALMKACTNVGQADRVEEVYDMIQQYNIRGTAELYTIAVRSCSQTGDWTFACNIYNDMRRNGVEPDEMFFSALVDVAGHAGNIDAAFEVLQEATLEGMKLGIMPYSSLMGACCTTKSWRKALQLYDEIKALGLVPTVTTMNALITALCEGNQLQKALEVFIEMKNMGLSPNDITYSILFVASEKNDDLDAGLMLLSQIKADSVPLNVVMCKCLIGLCSRSVEKTAALGELSVSFMSGKPQIDNEWTSLAVMIYREATAAGMTPSMEVLSEVLGCLQLPANTSLRERLVELLGVDIEASKTANFFSLIDGFGEYDLRAFSLLEEAASLGIVPSVSFKGSPIMIDARKWPIHVAEVYLLTVLKGLKHRLAAGAKLPTVSILLPVEVKTVVSQNGEKTTNVAGRVGQAIGAMLRRRGLPYQGNESYGKIRISGRTLRRWFQPKAVGKQSEFSLSAPKLGKQIADQRRNIRTETYTLY